MAGKWNYKTKEYDPYNPDWELKLTVPDLKTQVHCAQCGACVEYGKSYTSMEVHTPMGMGYPVCTICYEEELERRKASEK